ncbi:slipin family protein [Brevibacillus humidisoli]|uniref:slipin family protein n=1 Tax=Brevibacillus humidisoli TaxID=2895522 RepID=UPI001E45CF21|nr:slipin family protein [Brevibacillus humidisoli]UFJ41770.1 slipin family protein [Brevibacillus humidisoli]
MKKVQIANDERGLLFRNGNYIKYLRPGSYLFPPFVGYHAERLDINEPFEVPGKNLNLFLHDQELLKDLVVIDVPDHEYVLHFEDGRFANLYTSGKYAFWNVIDLHDFVRVDIRNPEVSSEIDRSIFQHSNMFGYYSSFEVASYETGILYYNHTMQKELPPGKYFFWRGPVSVQVKTVDTRQQQLDMTGQEMMTEDKVTLRLNFVCQYKITNPLKITEIKDFEEQVYILLQLILREYVGTLKLDDLLKMKQEVGSFVLSRLNEKSAEFGVQFIYAGVKDIILPGDVKEILNTVLLAEKKAQANIITRREETASTRSLLNTAKLMDENQTLYRLKELEFLEKICEKIGNVSLVGGGNLLEQLNSLLATRDREK